jgi:hypothetical protein
MYELMPLTSTNDRQTRQKGRKSRETERRQAPERTGDNEVNTETDTDLQFMDNEMQQLYSDLNNQFTPVINLQSQAVNDIFIEAVIQYLTDGKLPLDRELAKRILFQIEDFYISNDQLFHLARNKSRKRGHLMAPRLQQLVIPKAWRMQIMQAIHDFSHFAFLKCYLTARQKYFWVGMASDFKAYTDSCLVCQQIKNTPQPKYPITSIPPANLFDMITIDFHTVKQEKRFQKDDIFRHVLVIVESLTQFVLLIPCKTQTAEEAAQAIMDHYILKFGCFRYLISDRGSSWLNELFQTFLKMPNMKICHYKTSPYHPATNSLSEIQNKHILRILRAECSDKKDFHLYLPTICAGANALTSTALNCSPFYALYGVNYRWPIDTALTTEEQSFRGNNYPQGLQGIAERLRILREIVKQNVEDARQNTERVRNVNAKPHDFQIGQRVFVSQLLESSKIKNKRHSPQYVGPYVIIDSHSSLVRLQHYYTGKILKNWINVCHLKRLKDESRLKLYNRLKANESDSDTTPDVEQRTVQTMLGPTLSHRYEPREFNTSYNGQNERSGWNALTESQTAESRQSRDEHMVYGKPHSFTNAAESLNSTRTKPPTVAWPAQQSCAQIIKTQFSRMPALQTPSLAAGRSNSTNNVNDAYTTSFPIDVATNRQPPIDKRDMKHIDSKATHMIQPQIRAGNEKQILEPVTKTGNQLKMQPIDRTSVDIQHREQCWYSTVNQWSDDKPHSTSDCNKSVQQSLPAYGTNMTDCRAFDQLVSTAAQTYATDVSKPAMQPMLNVLSDHSVNQHETNCRSQIISHDQQLRDIVLYNRPNTHNQPGANAYECYQNTKSNIPEAQYDFKIIKISACKRQKSQRLFKAHYHNAPKTRWVTITHIPPKLLANFYTLKFQKKKCKTDSKKVLLEGETNGVG